MVGKVRKKLSHQGGREGGERKRTQCAHWTGARTWDLPCARGESQLHAMVIVQTSKPFCGYR